MGIDGVSLNQVAKATNKPGDITWFIGRCVHVLIQNLSPFYPF